MEDNRLRIVQAAHDLFNARGYKSVTISDLADRLGMSKKTIYQYFSGKEEIAAAVIEGALARVNEIIDMAESQQSDPLHALQDALIQVKDQITLLGPLFLEDVQKFLPDLWQRIEQLRAEKIKFIERLLQRAQDAGLVKDIEPRLAMVIFFEAGQALIRPDSLSRHGFSMVDVLDALIKIFYTGIVEPKIFEPNVKL